MIFVHPQNELTRRGLPELVLFCLICWTETIKYCPGGGAYGVATVLIRKGQESSKGSKGVVDICRLVTSQNVFPPIV